MSFPAWQGWKLCRRIECGDRSLTYELPDRLQARLWLEQFARKASAMIAIRTWLASQHDGRRDVSRMSDQAIIEHVAALISRGVVHVHTLAATREPEPPMAPSRPREEPVEAAPRNQPRAVTPVDETETSTFQDDVDLAAQAATLTAAAANGTPFCPT